jgi:hypothetical protein
VFELVMAGHFIELAVFLGEAAWSQRKVSG